MDPSDSIGGGAIDAPTSPVSSKLGIHLSKYAPLLKELGYEDASTWGLVEANELNDLVEELKKRHVPMGHLHAIRRTFLRQSPGSNSNAPLHTPAPSSTSGTLPATEQRPPSSQHLQPNETESAPPTPPVGLSVSNFPVAMSFLQLVETHGRSYFGRDDQNIKLSRWQERINLHIIELVRSKPQLIRKGEKSCGYKLGEYFDLARAAVQAEADAGKFNFVKPSGSRSSTLPSPSSGDTDDHTAKPRTPKLERVTISPSVRQLRLAELPTLIKSKQEQVRSFSYYHSYLPRCLLFSILMRTYRFPIAGSITHQAQRCLCAPRRAPPGAGAH